MIDFYDERGSKWIPPASEIIPDMQPLSFIFLPGKHGKMVGTLEGPTASRLVRIAGSNMIDPKLLSDHNLTLEEYERIVSLIGREPNITELGIFSLMWSEHCSYKNSKPVLKTFPTKGPQILVGAGEENAGVTDIGDGWAISFKIESHNHPSFVEPFQGAATGVGGILRDIFTMGARPVCAIDSLRFGPITENGGTPPNSATAAEPRAASGKSEAANNRRLLGGVVAGIAHYGNCFGIPTIADTAEISADLGDANQPVITADVNAFSDSVTVSSGIFQTFNPILTVYGNLTMNQNLFVGSWFWTARGTIILKPGSSVSMPGTPGRAWIGYKFEAGDKLALEFTPAVGGVFGDTNGIAPGWTFFIRSSVL
jgi:hypothetical protein